MKKKVKTKLCKFCGIEKNTKEFNRDSRTRDGLFNKCKLCLFKYREKYIKRMKGRKIRDIIVPINKLCSKCKVVKPSIEFCKHIGNKDGLNRWCKECVSKYYKSNINAKKQYDKELRKKFRNRQPSEIIVPKIVKCNCCKKSLPVSKFVKCKSRRLGIDTRCKECLRKYHKDHIIEEKAYRDEHKQETNKRARDRRENNVEVRMRESLRSTLYFALKRQNVKKYCRTMDLVGCSISVLKKHIEDKFLSGMTWNNYGKLGWWIDHIIPCIAFDLTKPEEQKKCFHYTNLQPLWWRDNIVKNSYYDGKLIRRNKV